MAAIFCGMVLVATTFVSHTVGAMVILTDPRRAYWYFLYMLALTAALIAVSWWKGETPGWRWGEKHTDDRGRGPEDPAQR